jgi:hypothetical protein
VDQRGRDDTYKNPVTGDEHFVEMVLPEFAAVAPRAGRQ